MGSLRGEGNRPRSQGFSFEFWGNVLETSWVGWKCDPQDGGNWKKTAVLLNKTVAVFPVFIFFS